MKTTNELSPEEQAEPPVVFISYSHDSRDHKRWVSKLAETLQGKGIQVIFDQWELEPGDDVPKFMAGAVKKADRVLLICTEPYVRKANDGLGGAGYEAMIVTGELVRDLGTRKFIPIIRQGAANPLVPDCVSTRLHVNFSDDAEFEEKVEELLETIHKVKHYTKPPLGPNPFASLKSLSNETLARQATADAPFSEITRNAAAVYEAASGYASSGDLLAWRRLLKAVLRQSASDLLLWRERSPDVPQANEKDFAALHEHALEGVRCYMPFYAALTAGAESGNPEFSGQLGWLDEVATPQGWNNQNNVYWIDFPELLLFVGQALIGSMLMESQASQQAYNLAVSRMPKRWRNREQKALFLDKNVTGWPNVMLHTCTVAWAFLLKVFEEDWVLKAFGSSEHAKSSLCSYYQFLSFLNFISLSAKGKLDGAKLEWAVVVPLSFCRMGEEIAQRGYRTFLAHRDFLFVTLRENGLEDSIKLENHWKCWMQECGKWLGSVYNGCFDFEVPQASFPSDIVTKRLKIGDL